MPLLHVTQRTRILDCQRQSADRPSNYIQNGIFSLGLFLPLPKKLLQGSLHNFMTLPPQANGRGRSGVKLGKAML